MKTLWFCGDLTEKMRGRDSLPTTAVIPVCKASQDQSPDSTVPIPALISTLTGVYWSSELPHQPYPVSISAVLVWSYTSSVVFYILVRKPIIDASSIHNFSGKRLILSRKYLPRLLQNTSSFHITQVVLTLCVLDFTSPSSEGNIKMKRKSYLT